MFNFCSLSALKLFLTTKISKLHYLVCLCFVFAPFQGVMYFPTQQNAQKLDCIHVNLKLTLFYLCNTSLLHSSCTMFIPTAPSCPVTWISLLFNSHYYVAGRATLLMTLIAPRHSYSCILLMQMTISVVLFVVL